MRFITATRYLHKCIHNANPFNIHTLIIMHLQLIMHTHSCIEKFVHYRRTHIHNMYLQTYVCTLMPMYHTEIDIHLHLPLTLTPSCLHPPTTLPPSPSSLGTAGSASVVTIPMRGANSRSGVEGVCSEVQSGTHHTSQQQEGLRLA